MTEHTIDDKIQVIEIIKESVTCRIVNVAVKCALCFSYLLTLSESLKCSMLVLAIYDNEDGGGINDYCNSYRGTE